MSAHRNIEKICCVLLVFTLLAAVLFMNAEKLGVEPVSVYAYESKLFDPSVVHTIDIEMDDWDAFIDTCESEEYSACSVTIDGETYNNVGIRGKGNTSLMSVSSYGNGRYSFKVEFDQYDSAMTYHGLDKLSLNNIIQDNTYLKEYLVYQMMAESGARTPLCSYVYITVNGEDWGLYLAIEGVEDSFLSRNYGNDHGELYKPDSMDMGGGRGNGPGFNMDEFREQFESQSESGTGRDMRPEDMAAGGSSAGTDKENSSFTPPNMSDGSQPAEGGATGTRGMIPPDMQETAQQGTSAETGDPDAQETAQQGTSAETGDPDAQSEKRGGFPDMAGGFGGMSMGREDVSLIYTDDSYESYSNIFNNAKTDITDADRDRLIQSIKQLNEGENIEEVVNVEDVIRYFAVHNFVCNFDSYTGSMIHNYYLYEEEGMMSMIPWDYNLAYGSFSMGGGFGGSSSGSGATGIVNYPIDTPVSGGTVESRPMLSWIFADEEYTELYHQYFAEFIEKFYDGGRMAEIIDTATELISPYVEKDPTAFCTYEEFEKGAAVLREFCMLRAESVSGQLDGTIPADSEGQSADSSSLIDASHISISDMGGMGSMGGGGAGRPSQFDAESSASVLPDMEDMEFTGDGATEGGFAPPNMEGMQLTGDGSAEGGFAPPNMEGMEFTGDGSAEGGFAPPNMEGMEFTGDGSAEGGFAPPDMEGMQLTGEESAEGSPAPENESSRNPAPEGWNGAFDGTVGAAGSSVPDAKDLAVIGISVLVLAAALFAVSRIKRF